MPGFRHRARARVALAVLALLGCAASQPLRAQHAAREWTVDVSKSRLVIHVSPAGLLSPTLHPHRFQAEQWSGEISWDPSRPRTARVEVRVAADSLHDHQEKLSAKDVAKVEAQTRGPAVLDAAQFPTITFEAHEVEVGKAPAGGKGEFRGTLNGTLTLHGKTNPVSLIIQGLASADRFEASAATTFKQSDFGIKPYKAALGTIAVQDEVRIEILVVAAPAEPKAESSDRRSRSR